MDLECVGPVLEGVVLAHGLVRQFPRLPHRDEAGVQTIGNRCRQGEAASLYTGDLGDTGSLVGLGEGVQEDGERLPVAKNWCDVLEDDSRFGKVGDVANESNQAVHAHESKTGSVHSRSGAAGSLLCPVLRIGFPLFPDGEKGRSNEYGRVGAGGYPDEER